MAYRQGYFNQGFSGYEQQMQPMYQPQAYPMPQNQTVHQADQFFCRAASNREEVQAWPADFNGNPLTFLGPNLQKIWVKVFNPRTGGSDVIDFVRAAPEKQPDETVPSIEDFHALQKLVYEQGEKIERIASARRRANRDQEVTGDD